ncbi:partial Zinc carboxypeptidase, partial [Planctomycetaceae bacterium]
SSGNACDTDYRGPSAASEPETQAVVNYVRSQYPDLRADDLSAAAPMTTSGLFLDLHSYSQLVLWPWGFTATPAPNSSALQTLGRKFAYFNNYTPQQSVGLYPTDGTTDDFAYGELGLPAYTFELGTNFFQDCTTFENTIVPNNLPALLYGLKSLRRPYQNPAGPDTLNVSVTPTSTLTGSTITLTATANDTRYRSGSGEPTQNIAAARYSLDAPSWITGTTTYPLNAIDGAFNNPIESLQAGVNLSGLSTGRHIIFVESRDANGNWGPPTAVFVWITLAPDSTIIGTIRAQDTGNPLDGAHISATLGTTLTFHATSLANGTYQLDVLAGIYDLHAVKYGYHGTTINAVQVQVGITASQDITLTPAAFYTVTGVVSDRDTGQPLSATIQVDGYPDAPIQTNASTGYYSITLAEDIAYTFQVNAMGYLPLDRSVGPLTSDRVEDFALDVDRDACIAPGYTFHGLHEAFTTTGTPTGWSVVNNVGSAGWRFDDPEPRGNLTGGSVNFAIADSDYAGSENMDTELRTPVLNFSALNAVTLTFKTDFYRYASEVADVDVSVNGASGPWMTVWHKSGASYRGPRTETLDLTTQAAGQANVMLRFRYYNANYEWWWQVDDVEIGRCMASVFSAPIFDPSAAAQSADPGTTITYTLQLSNTDSVAHTFDILSGAHAWPINAPTSLGPVNAQSAVPLTITVSIPANALANSADIVTLTAQAQDNSLVQANATLTTSANLVRGVQLEPASAQQDGLINQAVWYTLTVSNTGNWTDTFSLNATLAHWPVQLLPVSVTLPAHSDTFANVVASVPLTATPQLTDVVRVTVTGTEVSDFSELITRAIYAYQVHLPLILK